MLVPDLYGDFINDLFQRLDLERIGNIIFYKCTNCQLGDLCQGCKQCGEICPGIIGKALLVIIHLLSDLDNIDSVVADAFKITDTVEKLGNDKAV